MSVASILRDIAAELREHPERWTVGAMARDAKGRDVDARSDAAACWCVLGLIERDLDNLWLRDVAVKSLGLAYHAAEWNDADGRTAAEVADLLDRAAVKAAKP